IHDNQGKILGLVGVKRDITEQKKTERKLNEYHDQLEKLVEDRTSELTTANQSLQIEVVERRRIELELERQVEFEKLIATISTHFIGLTPGHIDDGINLALFTIGEFVGVDRAYVYLLSPDQTVLQLTHQWFDPALKAGAGPSQEIRVQSLSTWMEML